MSDQKSQVIRESAEAFVRALNNCGEILDIDIRMIKRQSISEAEPRAVYELRISRQHIEQVFP